MSICEQAFIKFEDPENFWRELTQTSPRILLKPIEFHENLIFSYKETQPSAKQVFLTKNCLYFFSSQGTTIQIYLKWCIFNPFIEELPNSNKKFGFTLTSYKNSYDFYVKNEKTLLLWTEKLSTKLLLTNFEDDFIIIKPLDSGQFGQVSLCRDIQTGAEFAVKTIKKSSLCSIKHLNYLLNEISIQKKLSHPNIVKLFKVYEENDCVHLVMEYVPNGNLLHRIQSKKKISESKIVEFSKSLLSALSYMHSKGVIHRDLKLENILLVSKEKISDFKIADFGLACLEKRIDRSCSGSPGYIAPEILKGKLYTSKVDLFGIGVLIYTLLTGCFPFNGVSIKQILEKNLICAINFNCRYFSNVSRDMKKILKRILSSDPSKRPSANEILSNYSIFQTFGCDVENLFIEGHKENRTFSSLAETYKRI